jgi:hypothetical protein
MLAAAPRLRLRFFSLPEDAADFIRREFAYANSRQTDFIGLPKAPKHRAHISQTHH